MAQDKTVQERIETILYAFGISNSGSVAEAIWEEIKEDQVDFIAQEVALREELESLKNKKLISTMMTATSFFDGLCNRTRNCLENEFGRFTDNKLFDLLETEPDQRFLRIPNFGKLGMKELRNTHRIMRSLREKNVDINLVAENERLRRERENLRMFLARMRNDIVEELE